MALAFLYGAAVFGTAVHAMAFPGPGATGLATMPLDGISPVPTKAPDLMELIKRQNPDVTTAYVAKDNTCGFISGSQDNPYTCNDAAAQCVVLTIANAGFIGCCDDTGTSATCGGFHSGCMDYVDVVTSSLCNALCMSNTFTLKCTEASAPYCNTVHVNGGTSLTVTGYYCNADPISTVQMISTTYDGETDARTFSPLTIGSNTASDNAQTFGGGGDTSSSAESSTTRPTTTRSSTTTSSSSSTTSPVTSSTQTGGGGGGAPVGAIVGGVVGGVAVIGFVILGVLFILRRRRGNAPTLVSGTANNQPPPPDGMSQVATPPPVAPQSPPPPHAQNGNGVYVMGGAPAPGVDPSMMKNEYTTQSYPTSPVPPSYNSPQQQIAQPGQPIGGGGGVVIPEGQQPHQHQQQGQQPQVYYPAGVAEAPDRADAASPMSSSDYHNRMSAVSSTGGGYPQSVVQMQQGPISPQSTGHNTLVGGGGMMGSPQVPPTIHEAAGNALGGGGPQNYNADHHGEMHELA